MGTDTPVSPLSSSGRIGEVHSSQRLSDAPVTPVRALITSRRDWEACELTPVSELEQRLRDYDREREYLTRRGYYAMDDEDGEDGETPVRQRIINELEVRRLVIETHVPVPVSNEQFMNKIKSIRIRKQIKDCAHFCLFNTGPRLENEIWDMLKDRLPGAVFERVKRISKVVQLNGKIRFDISVQMTAAPGFKSLLSLDYQERERRRLVFEQAGRFDPTRYWRIDFWRSKRDRTEVIENRSPSVQPSAKHGITTFNVRGLKSKYRELLSLLARSHTGVAAIQETKVRRDGPALRLEGFNVYHKPKEAGFEGHALAIANQYSSFELSHKMGRRVIHCQVMGWMKGSPVHVVSVYLPSGGNQRSDRSGVLNQVLRYVYKLVLQDPTVKIVILGDFNMERDTLARFLGKDQGSIVLLPVQGSALTRLGRERSEWHSLDHILVNKAMMQGLRPAKVWRHADIGSDHRPLTSYVRNPAPVSKQETVLKWDRGMLKARGMELVDRVSDMLDSADDEGEADLDEIITSAGKQLHMLREHDTGNQKQPRWPRAIYNKMKRARKAASDYRKMIAIGASTEECVAQLLKVEETERVLKLAKRKFERQQKIRDGNMLHGLLRTNDSKKLHDYAQRSMGMGKETRSLMPVRNENGDLCTNLEDISGATHAYFERLASDPTGKSKDKETWAETEDPCEDLDHVMNRDISAHELLLAIRKSANNTAAGSNGHPIEIYKRLLTLESTSQALRPGQDGSRSVQLPDAINVAIPDEELGDQGMTTSFGKRLLRVMNDALNKLETPANWHEGVLVLLHKKDDPTDLSNYRGITLSQIEARLMMSVIQTRVSDYLESRDYFAKEQSGFRPQEEAIAQFIASFDFIKRRTLRGQSTFVVYIDFKKAFDMVLHEALFEKLRRAGVGGKTLRFIEYMYHQSKVRVRVGDTLTKPFSLQRGTRQGCPLSPTLFAIFINDLMAALRESGIGGIEVPGLTDRQFGGMFADDVKAYAESLAALQALCDVISAWAQRWGMEFGHDKCKWAVYGPASKLAELRESGLMSQTVQLGGLDITYTDVYRYLGVEIRENFTQDSNNQEAHVRVNKGKALKVVNLLRPVLRNRHLPIAYKCMMVKTRILSVALYGSEWFGGGDKRCQLLQSAVNKALKLAVGMSSKTKIFDMECLGMELGLLPVAVTARAQRVRLFFKALKLKTWIKDLVSNSRQGWVQQTNKIMKELTNIFEDPKRVPEMEQELFNRPCEWLERMIRSEQGFYTGIVEHHYEYLLDGTPLLKGPLTDLSEQDRDLLYHLARYIDAKSSKTNAWSTYSECGFGLSRRWLSQTCFVPHLQKGVMALLRARAQARWDVQKRIQVSNATGQDTHLKAHMCPLCDEEFLPRINLDQLRVNDYIELNPGPLVEITHIMLTCKKLEHIREETVGPIIGMLTQEIADWDLDLFLTSEAGQGPWQVVIAALLLGAWAPVQNTETGIPDGTTNIGPYNIGGPFTYQFRHGWGHYREVRPEGMAEHGFVPVAQFLGKASYLYDKALFGDSGISEKSDDVTIGQRTPDKRSAPRN